MNSVLKSLLEQRQEIGMESFRYRVQTSVALAQQAGTEEAPTGFQTVGLATEPNEYFLLTGFMGSSSRDSATAFYNNNFSVRISCESWNKPFSNVRIPQRILCGTVFNNLSARRPILIPPDSQFSFDIANLSTAGTNTINVYMTGYKVRKPSDKMLETSHIKHVSDFFYLIRTAAMAANGSNPQNMKFDQDSWFELHSMIGYSSVDAATDRAPNNYSAQITDASGSGYKWSNVKIEQRAFASNIYDGVFERNPVLVKPNTSLTFEFTDLSGGANTVTMVAKGYKHYIN